MKKVFKLENLECAHCAAKMEAASGKLDGIEDCNLSFMTQKLTVQLAKEDLDELIPAIEGEIKKVDHNVNLVAR